MPEHARPDASGKCRFEQVLAVILLTEEAGKKVNLARVVTF
jgi:hypothetical protein